MELGHDMLKHWSWPDESNSMAAGTVCHPNFCKNIYFLAFILFLSLTPWDLEMATLLFILMTQKTLCPHAARQYEGDFRGVMSKLQHIQANN